MLVDYHFHPNLSKYDFFAQRKCVKIWREFKRQGVDVVVATEHVFKNPPRAYQLLQAARPVDATTVLFPGIEALTSEGIDIIVFAQDDQLYQHQKLMVPRQLSELEMVQYIKQQTNLVGSIAHPVLWAHSGSEQRVGKNTTITAIRTLGGVEISNSCLKGFVVVMRKLKLEHILKKQRQQCAEVAALPLEYYDFPEVTLYTGGSDAHALDEIGSGLQVADALLSDRAAVFQAIRTNISKQFITRRFGVHPYFAFYKLYTVVRESLIKAFRLYEGKLYQNDDAFTNYYSEAEKEAVLEIRRQRAIVLKPLLNFLTYFRVSPTVLNVISFVCIIFSVLQVNQGEPWDALLYFMLYLFTNSLTGPLARYQNVESEAGAITKIILYQVALIVAVLAAMTLEWVGNWIGTIYLLLYTTMLWLTITLNKVGAPIRLVIRSKNIVLAAILLKMIADLNWIELVLWIFSAYMLVMNVLMIGRLLLTVQDAEKTST